MPSLCFDAGICYVEIARPDDFTAGRVGKRESDRDRVFRLKTNDEPRRMVEFQMHRHYFPMQKW